MPRKNRTAKTAIALETLTNNVVAAAPVTDYPANTDGIPLGDGAGPFTDPATEPMLQPVPVPEIATPTELAEIAALDEVQVQPAEAVEAATVHEDQAEAIEEVVQKLEDALAAISDEVVDQDVVDIATQIDRRAAFEAEKNPDNTNIQRTLKKARNQMVTKRAARLLAVASVDPAFLNREIHSGARYNVYAIGKLADVVYGVTGGAISNQINLAILKSMFRCRAAGITFTGELAKAAASDKIRIEGPAKTALVRHNVDSGTAPTQASSTMTALETLGIVTKTGTARAPVYTLTNSPLTRRVEELLIPA